MHFREVFLGSLATTLALVASAACGFGRPGDGGAPDPNAWKNRVRTLAGSLDPSLCSSPAIDAVLAQLATASDIMADGTQDPTKTCDGISLGLGFEAHLVHLGATTPPGPTMPDPCTDAGTDGP